MNYKTRGAKIRLELVKDGKEVVLLANREGLRYLAEICSDLAEEQYVPGRPPHHHVEPALNTAEPGSLAVEIQLNPNL